MRPKDIVILHDPQPAGLTAAVSRAGAHVVWRCHVGVDTPNEHSERGWAFVRPYIEEPTVCVLVPSVRAGLDPAERLAVIAPSIDPFSSKNVELNQDTVTPLLRYVGLLADEVEVLGAVRSPRWISARR